MKIKTIIFLTVLTAVTFSMGGCFNSCPKNSYKTLESMVARNADALGRVTDNSVQRADDYLIRLTMSHNFIGQSLEIYPRSLFPAAYAKDDCGFSGRLGLKHNIESFTMICDGQIDGVKPGSDLLTGRSVQILVGADGVFDRIFRFTVDEWIDLMNNGITSDYYEAGLDMHAVSITYFELKGDVPIDVPLVFTFDIVLDNGERKTAETPPIILYTD